MARILKLTLVCLLTTSLLFPGVSFARTSTNSTLVTLKLSFAENNSWTQMCFSNNNQEWCEPEPLASLKENWDLTAYGGGTEDGVKCIYVKFQDSQGNWGNPFSACLELDTITPISDASPHGGNYTFPPIVSLSANEPATIYYTTDGSTPNTDSLVYSSPLEVNSFNNLQFFALDQAGNSEDVHTEEYIVDRDQDGLLDTWEITYGLNPNDGSGENGPAGDPDGDSLTNLQEYDLGTSPVSSDTDGDGMADDWEVDHALDPLTDDATADTDEDGYNNLEEYNNGTNPQHAPVTYYVDAANVDDNEEDGSRAHPFDSIEEALTGTIEADDTVQVFLGTYQVTGDIILPEGVKVIGEHWYVCSIDLGNAYQIQVSSSSTLTGFSITNPPTGQHVVEAYAASSVTITNNVIQGNMEAQPGFAGIFINESTARVENNTIDGGHTAIRTKDANGSTIVNNIVLNNVYAWINTDSSAVTVDYNNFWENTNAPDVTPTNNISENPLFVDSANGNYHLKQFPTPSPCIDAGNEVTMYHDKDGSRNDMGADGGPKGAHKDTTPPSVIAAANPINGPAPLIVGFTGTAADEWEIASWSWDFDNLDGLQEDSADQNPTHLYDFCESYIATLTVTDHSGNSSSTTITNIAVDNPATVNVSVNPIATTISSTITFSGSASGSSLYTWIWDFGDGTAQIFGGPAVQISEATHSYANAGSYIVTLIVINDSDCKTPTIVPVTVVDNSCIIHKSQEVLANTATVVEILDPGSAIDGTSVSIPYLALPNDTVISISELTAIPAFPEGTEGVGVPVDFGPENINFSKPVTITLPYPSNSIVDPYDLTAYYYDTDVTSWIEIAVTEVDTGNQLIFAQTNHFTTFALGTGAPTAPNNLTANAVSASQINLSWTDNSSNENGFTIERRTTAGNYTEIAVMGANITFYQDSGLHAGIEYYYRTRAYNATGDSTYSNQDSTTTLTQAAGSGGVQGAGGGGGGGCFIATAAYGTPLAKQVQTLCLFRDKYLLTNQLGRRFIDFYYKYSPPIAEYIAQRDLLKKLVRIVLWPLVFLISFLLEATLLGRIITMGGILLGLLGLRLIKKSLWRQWNIC